MDRCVYTCVSFCAHHCYVCGRQCCGCCPHCRGRSAAVVGVCLFALGESAGGFSVCWHLIAPGSAGLFSAAIMESGMPPTSPSGRECPVVCFFLQWC